MSRKPKLLVWSDWFGVGTGFGTVSKHVIQALIPYFEIDQLAINYNGEFFDREIWPVQVVPARLNNAQDPYGLQMFADSVLTGKYDYVWIMNDSFTVHKVGKELPKVFQQMAQNHRKVPVIVYYCPVDCVGQLQETGMLTAADKVVAYCEFGKNEMLTSVPEIKDKVSVITHGVEPKIFHKVDSAERKMLREQLLRVTDDDTFIWMNVNRNSPRKDIARTILAFSEFRKEVPNSKLYLHTVPRDTTINLFEALKHLNLSVKDDVLFPGNYAPHKPYPAEVLNSFYNCGDAFITTTLGEGWGLTHLDAALVGMPIVAPENTCFPEQLANGARGYLYSCKESYWIDNSGYRPLGRVEDITQTMLKCYRDTKSGENKQLIENAKQYALSLDWKTIGDQWVDLFKKLASQTKIMVPKTGLTSVKI